MGMFDEKKYLTGDNGEFKLGDVFTLHSAELVGQVKVNNELRTEAKLSVQRQGQDRFTCFTSGRGIVGAVERMEPGDLPAFVKLGTKDTRNGPMHTLERAEAPS